MDSSLKIEGFSFPTLDKKSSNKDFDDRVSEKEIEILNQQLDRYKNDTKQRNVLAIWTQIINTAWLGLVMFILMLNKCWFELSDTVLVTLLGTTTINVIGLALVVLQGFFKNMDQNISWFSKKNKKEDTKKD